MMRTHTMRRMMAILGLLVVGSLFAASDAWAHCDGLDGPVVAAAERSLETGDVRHALVWVLPGDEAEIRHAFEHAMEVRGLSDDARALADRHFFETLVRVHRASEGAPYTGLKPAGRDLGPAIPAADRALETGSVDELEAVLIHAIREGLRERFAAARAAYERDPTDVEAGREYVRAYVPFLHYAEELYDAATAGGHHDPAPDHGRERGAR